MKDSASPHSDTASAPRIETDPLWRRRICPQASKEALRKECGCLLTGTGTGTGMHWQATERDGAIRSLLAYSRKHPPSLPNTSQRSSLGEPTAAEVCESARERQERNKSGTAGGDTPGRDTEAACPGGQETATGAQSPRAAIFYRHATGIFKALNT